MKKMLLLWLVFCLTPFLYAQELQRASRFNHSINIDNWYMSEKLDGIRAYWDGKELKTRQGNIILVPLWFTQNFPPFELDGELWSKRQDFENIQSIVLNKTSGEKWKQLSYHIFEVPQAKGNFAQRLEKAQQWFSAHKTPYVKIIPQKLCRTTQEAEAFLKEVLSHQGEGVMLKNPQASYETGRTAHLLKFKQYEDMEGVVVGLNYNASGKLKSLLIELPHSLQFKLGTGFTQEQREHPPQIGSVVTFKYFGFTKYGKPKFASFLHIRKD